MQKEKSVISDLLAHLVRGGTFLSHHRRQAKGSLYVLWCGFRWGCICPLPFPCEWASRGILWCDVFCEFRGKERWKWFVRKSTEASKMSDVWLSMSLRMSEAVKKGEWWWLIIKQQKTHVQHMFQNIWAFGERIICFFMVSLIEWAIAKCGRWLTCGDYFSCMCNCTFSWVSVLQNSKEEALNTALGGDQQDSGLQELSQSIIAELRHMPGNEACADCGAPGQPVIADDDHETICENTSED